METSDYEFMENKIIENKYNDIYTIKVCLVGDSNTGKSTLFNRLLNQEVLPYSTSTIGVDFGATSVIQNNILYKIHIWDTAGHEKFKTITKNYYRNMSHILLLFDLSNKRSFTHIKDWIRDITYYGEEDTIIILIGNKSDTKYEIDIQEINMLLNQYICISNYIEISTAHNNHLKYDEIKNLIISNVQEKIHSFPITTLQTEYTNDSQIKYGSGIYKRKKIELVPIKTNDFCCTIS